MKTKKFITREKFEKAVDKICLQLDKLCTDWTLSFNYKPSSEESTYGHRYSATNSTNVLGLIDAARESCVAQLLHRMHDINEEEDTAYA